jgi:hypothetical protein
VIVFVVTSEHQYTLQAVVQNLTEVKLQIATYDQLFDTIEVPRATYIFTDLDRLPIWRVHQAAIIYRQLRDAGVKVLNDPARILSRFGLLRKLYRCGINCFDAYRVEEEVVPARWPVFLRTEGDHKAPVSGLLHNQGEVEQAIAAAIDTGVPIVGMLLVEFAAEPVRPGLFRKLSTFRIGDTYFGANCVHEDNWLVKYGTEGVAPPDLYEEDLRIVRDNPFEAALKPVFDIAGIDYGRIDFGIVGGRIQIYEINSNPTVGFPTEHPSAYRVESYDIFKRNFFNALTKADSLTA